MKISSISANAANASDIEEARLTQEMTLAISPVELQIIRNIAGVPDIKDSAAMDQYAQQRNAEQLEAAVKKEQQAADQSARPIESMARIISKHVPV